MLAASLTRRQHAVNRKASATTIRSCGDWARRPIASSTSNEPHLWVLPWRAILSLPRTSCHAFLGTNGAHRSSSSGLWRKALGVEVPVSTSTMKLLLRCRQGSRAQLMSPSRAGRSFLTNGPKDLRSCERKKIPRTGGPWHLRRGRNRHSKYTPGMSRQWLQPSSPVAPWTPRSFCGYTSSPWRNHMRQHQEYDKLSVRADYGRNPPVVIVIEHKTGLPRFGAPAPGRHK